MATALVLDGRPFTRAIALRAGLLGRDVSDLLAGGGLRQPLRGVYVDSRTPEDLPGRAAAVRLVLPDGAAVSRRTAAWLYGVDARGPDEQTLPIECTVPTGVQPMRRAGIRCFAADLGDDVHDVDGLPCTRPGRTVTDLLRWLRPHTALACADEFAARGTVTVPELVDGLERWKGHPGVARARYLAGLVEPLAESRGESWLRLRIADAGFPVPRAQIPLLDGSGRVVFRLDLGWEDVRIAIEYDGLEFHTGREARHRDLERDTRIQRDFGWFVRHVGRSEVLGSSLALERDIGELLGLEPRVRRRLW